MLTILYLLISIPLCTHCWSTSLTCEACSSSLYSDKSKKKKVSPLSILTWLLFPSMKYLCCAVLSCDPWFLKAIIKKGWSFFFAFHQSDVFLLFFYSNWFKAFYTLLSFIIYRWMLRKEVVCLSKRPVQQNQFAIIHSMLLKKRLSRKYELHRLLKLLCW